jgi:hypothetical protein
MTVQFQEAAKYLYCFYNGAERDRTADLLNAIQALSQLSYGPGVWVLEFGAARRCAFARSRRKVK